MSALFEEGFEGVDQVTIFLQLRDLGAELCYFFPQPDKFGLFLLYAGEAFAFLHCGDPVPKRFRAHTELACDFWNVALCFQNFPDCFLLEFGGVLTTHRHSDHPSNRDVLQSV